MKWLLRTRSYKDFNTRSPVQLQLSHYPTLLHLFVSGHCVVMNNGINHTGMPWGDFLAEMLGTLFRSCLCFFCYCCFFFWGGRAQDKLRNKYLCGNQLGHSTIPRANTRASGVRVGCESNEIGHKSDACLSWWIL